MHSIHLEFFPTKVPIYKLFFTIFMSFSHLELKWLPTLKVGDRCLESDSLKLIFLFNLLKHSLAIFFITGKIMDLPIPRTLGID